MSEIQLIERKIANTESRLSLLNKNNKYDAREYGKLKKDLNRYNERLSLLKSLEECEN